VGGGGMVIEVASDIAGAMLPLARIIREYSSRTMRA